MRKQVWIYVATAFLPVLLAFCGPLTRIDLTNLSLVEHPEAKTGLIKIKTDTTWKCSLQEQEGWKEVNFDDSSWIYAAEAVGAEGWDANFYLALHPEVSMEEFIRNGVPEGSEKVIWYPNLPYQPAIVFFRKTFYLSEKPSYGILRIRFDDKVTIFVNGRVQRWHRENRYRIQNLVKGKNVIAIKGINVVGFGGFAAVLTIHR